MELLNVGCGAHFHPAWTNVDIRSSSPQVIAYDIRRGLPFGDAEFDVVYHSHVIEHLAPPAALVFMKQCVRVLKPGGRIRVVTPDLEVMARTYLGRLEAALSGMPGANADHHWMVLELFDQMTRSFPGGEMGRYLLRPDLENREFIVSRIGREATKFWERHESSGSRPAGRILTWEAVRTVARRLRRGLAVQIGGLIAGGNGRASFREGLFRNSGEVHRWLYDRYSLAGLMADAGMADARPYAASESGIADFQTYALDVVNGEVRKPDSLFMEARKPAHRASR